MKVPYTKSGKCGNTVWQHNRYCQIFYQAFIPFNPNTPAKIIVRLVFATVSARWRTLSQEQRDLWNAVGRTKWSRQRLGRGRLPGFNVFVQVNVPRAHRGQAQLDLPPEYCRLAQQAAWRIFYTSRFDQLPVASTPFLQANQLIEGLDHAPRRLATSVPPPT